MAPIGKRVRLSVSAIRIADLKDKYEEYAKEQVKTKDAKYRDELALAKKAILEEIRAHERLESNKSDQDKIRNLKDDLKNAIDRSKQDRLSVTDTEVKKLAFSRNPPHSSTPRAEKSFSDSTSAQSCRPRQMAFDATYTQDPRRHQYKERAYQHRNPGIRSNQETFQRNPRRSPFQSQDVRQDLGRPPPMYRSQGQRFQYATGPPPSQSRAGPPPRSGPPPTTTGPSTQRASYFTHEQSQTSDYSSQSQTLPPRSNYQDYRSMYQARSKMDVSAAFAANHSLTSDVNHIKFKDPMNPSAMAKQNAYLSLPVPFNVIPYKKFERTTQDYFKTGYSEPGSKFDGLLKNWTYWQSSFIANVHTIKCDEITKLQVFRRGIKLEGAAQSEHMKSILDTHGWNYQSYFDIIREFVDTFGGTRRLTQTAFNELQRLERVDCNNAKDMKKLYNKLKHYADMERQYGGDSINNKVVMHMLTHLFTKEQRTKYTDYLCDHRIPSDVYSMIMWIEYCVDKAVRNSELFGSDYPFAYSTRNKYDHSGHGKQDHKQKGNRAFLAQQETQKEEPDLLDFTEIDQSEDSSNTTESEDDLKEESEKLNLARGGAATLPDR